MVSQWLSQLHAAKWALQGPFEDLFVQESSGSDRAVAATALAEFLADKPEQLVELIKLAQPRELAILVDQLQSHGTEAAALVESELLREDMAVSQDTFESKEEDADAELNRRLERVNGMMTPQFALCLSLPLADLNDLIDTMRVQGFRPIRCRPYVMRPDDTHVAVVWTRDNLKWKFQTGLSVSDVANNRAEMQTEGLRPLDVAGYRENGAWRYVAIWVADRFSKDEVRVQLLVGEDQWQQNYEEHRDAGFRSQTTQIALDEQGIRYRSQIWLRPGPSPVREQRSWLAPEDYRIKSEFPGVPVDLTSYVFESKEIRFGVIWHRDLHVKTKTLQHNTYQEHLKASHEIARQGYRPAVVSVVQQPLSELPKVVSIWRHLLPAKDVRNRIAASKANLAITLVRLGHIAPVVDYLKHPDHDLANHYFLHRVVESRIAPRQLVDMLDGELNDQARRSILLAIGQYQYEKLEPTLQSDLANKVTSLHKNDASSSVRSATEWLLEKWAVAVDANGPTRRGLEGAQGWYTTPRGQMMLTVPVKRQHSLYQVPKNDMRWISVSARSLGRRIHEISTGAQRQATRRP